MFRTTFIAVTGSLGKTTATECLAAVLASRFPTNATMEGRNARHHLAAIILRTRFRHRFTVIEVGAKLPGALRRAAWMVNPDVVVILSVTGTHTQSFRTLEETAAEKAQLLSRLGPEGLAVLNGDDPRVLALAAHRRFQVQTFGTSPQSDLWASDVSSRWPARLSFCVHRETQSHPVTTRLVGEHWLPSVLAALAAALSCGVDLQSAIPAIERVEPPRGRKQPVLLPCGATMLRDEFNVSIASFPAASRVLQQADVPRRLIVLADVTDSRRKPAERLRDLAKQAARSADVLIIAGAHEERAVRAALTAGMKPQAVHGFTAVPETAAFLQSELRPGDLVLLRGCHTAQMSLLYFAQLGTVGCTQPHCRRKVMFYDYCPDLHPGLERTAGLPAPPRPFWEPR
jgi:UDP-N-acetylmuramoyl-tripeptide--D-alanyl-D-alanine ligase